MKPTDSDEQLINSFRQTGETELLDQLVARNISMVRSVVYQMVLDDSLADDLTQEAFLKAIAGLSSFNGQSQFSTWMYRVALNTAHSYLRRQNRSPVEHHHKLPEPKPSKTQIGPEQSALQAELEEEVEMALGSLSPKLRAAIVLTSLQKLDVKRAAKIEGCSTATMYWRVHEARKQLKTRLERYLNS